MKKLITAILIGFYCISSHAGYSGYYILGYESTGLDVLKNEFTKQMLREEDWIADLNEACWEKRASGYAKIDLFTIERNDLPADLTEELLESAIKNNKTALQKTISIINSYHTKKRPHLKANGLVYFTGKRDDLSVIIFGRISKKFARVDGVRLNSHNGLEQLDAALCKASKVMDMGFSN